MKAQGIDRLSRAVLPCERLSRLDYALFREKPGVDVVADDRIVAPFGAVESGDAIMIIADNAKKIFLISVPPVPKAQSSYWMRARSDFFPRKRSTECSGITSLAVGAIFMFSHSGRSGFQDSWP